MWVRKPAAHNSRSRSNPIALPNRAASSSRKAIVRSGRRVIAPHSFNPVELCIDMGECKAR